MPTVALTAKWKFGSRFINSRRNAQYMPGYRLICYTNVMHYRSFSRKRNISTFSYSYSYEVGSLF